MNEFGSFRAGSGDRTRPSSKFQAHWAAAEAGRSSLRRPAKGSTGIERN